MQPLSRRRFYSVAERPRRTRGIPGEEVRWQSAKKAGSSASANVAVKYAALIALDEHFRGAKRVRRLFGLSPNPRTPAEGGTSRWIYEG